MCPKGKHDLSKLFTFFIAALLLCFSFNSYSQGSAAGPVNPPTAPTHIGGYHVKCHGQNSTYVSANTNFGKAPYTYLWSTGDTSKRINNKPAGIYYVTVTDSNMVSKTDTVELLQPDSLYYQMEVDDFNGYNIRTQGGEGSARIIANGGTPPYKYLWDDGSTKLNRGDLTTGTFTFTITDANQCVRNGSVTLNAPAPVQISFSGIENPQCARISDGKATLNISGGLGDFSVVWENGNFSLSPEDLGAGYNAVRIFENGEPIIDTGITLTEPDAVDIQFAYSDYNGFNVSCVDCYNGSITTTVTGGTAPYTYLWDDLNASTTANLSNMNGGIYYLKVIDANGCKFSSEAQLTMPISQDWSRFGNSNIDTAMFIGSTDTSAVKFKANNQESLRLSGNGNVGIKNSNPTEALDIIGNLKTSGMMIFDNQSFMAPMSGANSTLSGIFFGLEATPLVPIARPACMTADKKTLMTDGFFVSSAVSQQGKPTTYFGNDGANGIIESTSESATSTGSTALLLNYYCGNDVVVGKLTGSGNLIANNKLGIGVGEPNEKLEVAGNAIVNGRLSVGGHDGSNNYFATSTDYQLCVNGKIVATEVLVKTRATWPDYVFKKDYKLKSIKEVSEFISKYGHLPEVPSAASIEKNGVNTGEMLTIQMQKIEELMLYIADLQKQIDALKQAKN